MGEEHSSQLPGLPGGSVKLDVDITRTRPTKGVLFLGSTCNLVLHSGGSGGILYDEKGLANLGKNQHRIMKQRRDRLQTFCVVYMQFSQICEFFFFFSVNHCLVPFLYRPLLPLSERTHLGVVGAVAETGCTPDE